MGHPPGVRADCSEHLGAVEIDAIRDSPPHAAKVGVITEASHLDSFAIQEQAFVGIKMNIASTGAETDLVW